MKYLTLYNPLANNGKGEEAVNLIPVLLPNDEIDFLNITKIQDFKKLFSELPESTCVIICGGDGTLNKFVNNTKDINITHKLLYFPCGSGNDFARDVENWENFIPLNEYIQYLPTVTLKEKDYLVLNGIGFGIDGYCCEEGDRLRKEKPKKRINYTSIAVKGLLFHYKPTDATVIADGKKYSFKKVWLSPGMNGRYYGGGMIPTPDQNRKESREKVSVMVFHGSGKLKTLCIFPSIFKGEHVKKTKNVKVITGNSITVKFSQPRSAQIDGETVTQVYEYTLKSAYAKAKERSKRLS